MMHKIKNRSELRWLLLCSVFVSAFFMSTRFAQASPVLFTPNISIPIQSLDFSDLDARDELNRPITSNRIVSNFSEFVDRALCESLLENLTPHNRFIRNLLSLKWDLISGWFKKTVDAASTVVRAIFTIAKKIRHDIFVLNAIKVAKIPLAISQAAHTNFLFLISSLLSSIQILR
jgi:hypothetical protein